MSLPFLHDRLADTATYFIGFLGLWALLQGGRARPLGPNWFGAALIGELLIVVQGAIGAILYLQGLGAVLPRPFMHILYGVVALITLPAAYSYFGNLEDERVKAFAIAAVCFFLWGILLRAASVAQTLPSPVL